jgi:hypothetical protein
MISSSIITADNPKINTRLGNNTLRIRAAKEEDKPLWDSFVDIHEGSFNYYFDCRYVDKNIRQLIVETDQSQVVCLCSFERDERALYSSIRMNGILFRKDATPDLKYRASLDLLEYIENNYGEHCSTFIITEEIKLGSDVISNSRNAFIDHNFLLRNSSTPDLPCSHILPLKAPFEQYIWQELWSSKFRQALNKVSRTGIKVIQDREFKYLDTYIDLLYKNFKRHGAPPPKRSQIIAEFNVFKDKTKLFVALLDNRPIVILNCHYTYSTCFLSGVGSFTKGTEDINKYVYKVAVEDACNNGYKFADFGHSYTEGLAGLKERYKCVRIPVRIYEKRYSTPRVFAELTPGLFHICFNNTSYLWKERRMIWQRIAHW